jgi:hypothetical protein
VRRAIPLFAIALVAAAGAAYVRAETSSVPSKYRFTGWAASASGPQHWFVEGDGIGLHLRDIEANDQNPTAYRVCWAPRGGFKNPCWSRTVHAWAGSSVANLGVPLPGRYTARWTIGSRTVATWPFIVVGEPE